MRNPENERYVKLGVTLGVVAIVAIAAQGIVSSLPALGDFLSTVLGILMPFVYGAVIAYLLAPLCNKVEGLLARHLPKLKGAGGIAIGAAYLIAVLVIVLLLVLVIPSLVESIVGIVQALPAELEAAAAWLSELFESDPELQASWDEYASELTASIEAWLETDLMATATVLAEGLTVSVTGFATTVYNLFLGLLISVYCLGSRKNFARQAKLLLAGALPPAWADKVLEEVRYADRMFNGFLVGRVVDSAIVGVICFVFCFVCGFDSAVLVSVLVGVTNIIPVFGPYLGGIPSAIILLLESPMHGIIFIVFILILQQVDGNVIGPTIVGSATGLNSFWIMFSVLFFGGLWGLVGMLVGVPIFAVVYDIVRQLAYLGLRRHGRTDLLEPPQEGPAEAQVEGQAEVQAEESAE